MSLPFSLRPCRLCKRKLISVFVIVLGIISAFAGLAGASTGTDLLVGAAVTDISPKGPVALAGQMHTRISQGVRSPLTATAISLESRKGGVVLDQAIMVSCDLIAIPDEILNRVRQTLKERLPDFDVKKLFLSATHTHSGPVLQEGLYEIPREGIVQPAEYVRFLAEQLTGSVEKAWNFRKPGGAGWGLGHAVVAQNRRAVYADGRARMYGRTKVPHFRGIEGFEDHDVDVLFFWDKDKKLMAAAVNVACPAQEVENNMTVGADFWHEVREMLHQRYSKNLAVLGWIGAAGDQSPHLMYRKQAEERMRKLSGRTRLQEIARRICWAVEEAYEGGRNDIRVEVQLVHKVEKIGLPVCRVTQEEMANARKRAESLSKDPRNKRRMFWHQGVVDRYQRQKNNPHFEVELHVIRVGDVAICTNPFELFTDFGIQIKARSRAIQTFVIQLAGQGTYIPTQKAIRGGDYSTTVESTLVGPEGGQILVDRTVELINSLWAE